VWAALWSLPEAVDHALARDWFAQHLEGDYDAGEPLAAIAHGFTHYRLQLQPLQWREVALHARVADNDDLRWVARGELAALGIPAPIRKLLETMLPEGRP
jgi:A/G-specific adenine glycosylase